MKRILFFSARALGLAVLGFFAGCNKQQPSSGSPQTPGPATPQPTITSAEPTSFRQVTAQLDPGGNFYLYLSTEQWLEGLSTKVSRWRGLADVIPNVASDDRANIIKVFDIVTNLIHDCGVEEISGFGMSSIAREKGFYRTKALLHHYPGKGDGFAWKLFGEKPHPLSGHDLLPTTTALAAFSDLDLAMVWSVLQKQAARSGLPEAGQFLDQLPAMFESATGLKWDLALGSLGGEFGLVLTLNDTNKIPLPLPGASGPLEIPEVGLMLITKVKDDLIFKRIDEALKNMGQAVISSNTSACQMRTVPVPLPLPIQLRPSVALSSGYLFVATSDALIQEALAVKAGQKPGLKSTDEFRRLAADIPSQGNHFTFLSRRFGQTLVDLQKNALSLAPKGGSQMGWLQSFLDSSNAAFSYTVSGNTDEGWLSVCNGNQHPAKMLLVGAAVPLGMLSAIAIPNFVKARTTAQKNACINNLRQIDGAKQQWALEKKKSATDVPLRADLLPYFQKHKFPGCPAGGSYTIGPLSDPPQCDQAGHELPQ
jgi:hypothetical protein